MSRRGGERSLASHDDLHSRCSASQVQRSSYLPLLDTRVCRYDMTVGGESAERGTKIMERVV